MRLGLTLPSLREDPESVVAVARAAERAGVHGVFVFDHLFRDAADGTRRPALEMTAILGAVAAETERVVIGPLVARATLRPAATLAAALDTIQRVSGGRLVATLGSGDSQSHAENEAYGLPGMSEGARLAALGDAVAATRGRGYPVWVGGSSYAVRVLAGDRADGWNRWGGDAGRFAREARTLGGDASPSPGSFTLSWGGLVVLGADDAAAEAKRARVDPPPGVLVGGPQRVAEALAAYREAGARWAILGPVDSSDPENAAIVGELVAPALR